nr:pilin [Sinobacterium norvegicum]
MINFITPIEDEILAGNISPVAADVVLDETAEALVDGVTVTMAFNESSGTIEGKYGDKSGLLTGEVLALGRTVEGGWLCFWSGAEDYAPQGCGN